MDGWNLTARVEEKPERRSANIRATNLAMSSAALSGGLHTQSAIATEEAHNTDSFMCCLCLFVASAFSRSTARRFSRAAPPSRLLLVSNSCRSAVEFSDLDGERLIIGFRPILQDAQGHLLSQQNGPVGRTAEVYAGMNTVTKRDVVR